MSALLSLDRLLGPLDLACRTALNQQHVDARFVQPGLWHDPATDRPDLSHVHTSLNLSVLGLALAAIEAGRAPQASLPPADLLAERMMLAAACLREGLAATGRIDLPGANFDSGPDTAFLVQQLLAVHARLLAAGTLRALRVAESLAGCIRRAYDGLLDGGFHTPNHRWIWAAALETAGALLGRTEGRAVVDALLAERPDIDADGLYIERSAGVYDAVTNRAFLQLAQQPDRAELLAAVERNLTVNLGLLDSAGRIETALSTRQDRWMHPLAAGLIPIWLDAAARLNRPSFVDAALFVAGHWLDQARFAEPAERMPLFWMVEHLLRADPTVLSGRSRPASPGNALLRLEHVGLLRVRSCPLALSAMARSHRVMHITSADARIVSVSLAASYFGVGQFFAESLTFLEDGAELVSSGQQHPLRPSYFQPLGEPVEPAAFEESLTRRARRVVPPLAVRWRVQTRLGEPRVRIAITSTSGLPDVPAQLALDFAPGGEWVCGGCCFRPQPGQVIFLERGPAQMRYGTNALSLSLEEQTLAGQHRTAGLRDALPAEPGTVRVIVALRTPLRACVDILGQ